MKYKILDKEVFIDGPTGSFFFDYVNELNITVLSSPNYDNLVIDYSEYKPTFATFCINISDSCNLMCDYCFNKQKKNRFVSAKESIAFLEMCFKSFPYKEKYFIDLSGKGEPLLSLKRILEIKRYCDKKSDELRREVLVQLVCNGTLLDENTVSTLQNNQILFGVSIDGNRTIHDRHRKTKNQLATYQTIIENVNKIPNHDYVGAACTLTNDTFSLKESLIELSKTFKTISYKPSRNCDFSIDELVIDRWKKEYDELIVFLLNESLKGNNKYIKILLNGEDYLGKFIKRIVLKQRTIIRCDAGLSRLVFDDDGNIYSCPAAFKIKEFMVGTNNQLDVVKIRSLFERQKEKRECQKCDFRYICGGECQLEQYLNGHINAVMCEYKKHLILLAMYFCNCLLKGNNESFNKVYDFCLEVENRKKMNKELDLFLKCNPKYSFTEGKQIFDKLYSKY